MTIRFTILLPIFRSPTMLPFAIETVLAQTVTDFELFIICDGAPRETLACAREYAERDPRVHCFSFPKGQRSGEAYRHIVLQQASGRYVAQIADDDLWLPHHLQELDIMLQAVDFGHTPAIVIYTDGQIVFAPADLALPEFRRRIAYERFNRVGPTYAGYRLEAYRRLPVGWSPAPEGFPTDLHMWQKFLRRDDITAATRMAVTAIRFATTQRTHMSPDERGAEVRRWYERVRDPKECAKIVQAGWQSLVNQALQQEKSIAVLTAEQAKTQEEYAAFDAERARTEAECARLAAALAKAQEELGEIVRSTSWRWTGPFRAAVNALRRAPRAP